MYIQKVATILMDDEIHDILNEGNELGFQEYIYISEPDDINNLLAHLENLYKEYLDDDMDNIYLTSTIIEIKQALILLEKDEIENIVFVYQN